VVGVDRKRRRRVFERDRYRCRYCARDMTLHFPYPHLRVMTVDHIVPKVQGGTDRYDNLVICCHDCNNLKCNRGAAEFMRDLCAREPWPGADATRLRWKSTRALGARSGRGGAVTQFFHWRLEF
jgi:CRISPR/Cas system Type II protein with McrA/HNH and RuvC-like nuclease domain